MNLSDSLVIEDVVLAVVDHLVGDLHEESSHGVVGVVVTSDGVDHLDGVHQCWESILNCLRGAFIQWLNELFKSSKILNVVLGFIELFSNLKFNASPLAGGKIDLVSGFTELLSRVLTCLGEHIIHCSAVLAS